MKNADPPEWLKPLLESVTVPEPQPAPEPGQEDVGPMALLLTEDNASLNEVVRKRIVLGWYRYKTVLQTCNGRCALVDGIEEVGDLLQYGVQLGMEGSYVELQLLHRLAQDVVNTFDAILQAATSSEEGEEE